MVMRTAGYVWMMKREGRRLAARLNRQLPNAHWRFPPPWRLRLKRPGWQVTISVWLRRGRGPGRGRALGPSSAGRERRTRLHVGLTVTASMRHPLLGYPSLDDVPEGIAPRVTLEAKPESHRKLRAIQDAIPIPIPIQARGQDAALPSRLSGDRKADDMANSIREVVKRWEGSTVP